MKATTWFIATLLTGVLLWGFFALYRLFDEENRFQHAFLQEERDRQTRRLKLELLKNLTAKAHALPTSFSVAKVAVQPYFKDLVVVEKKGGVEAPHLLWPLPPSTQVEKDIFKQQWQAGHNIRSSFRAHDALRDRLGAPEKERLLLLDKAVFLLLESNVKTEDTLRALRAFQMHRERQRLHTAFEVSNLLRLVNALSESKHLHLSSWTELFFAGQPEYEDAPLGLFALSLVAHSMASLPLADDVPVFVREAAQRAGLPLSTWEAALTVKYELDLSKMRFENLCGVQTHRQGQGVMFLLGCRRGTTWSGKVWQPQRWLKKQNLQLQTSLKSTEGTEKRAFSFQWKSSADGSLDEVIDEVQVENPFWQERELQIRQTHQAKIFLLGIVALLSLLVAALSGQIRRQTRQWVKAKEDILQTVSHELKTPVASIRLMAETLERRLRGEERAKDYPARIVRETDRMQHLTDNLLSFQRVQKGAWNLTKESIDLEELLQEVLFDVQSLRQMNDEIHLEVPMALELYADRELLHLALRNLIKNALVYSSPPARVQVLVEENADECSIWVKDDGPGIPETLHKAVFGAFERGNATKGGTGLGLALVQSCMNLHQGEALLFSSTAMDSSYKGAVFQLRFPKSFRAKKSLPTRVHKKSPS